MNTKYLVGAKLIESGESLGLEYASDDIFIWYGGRSIYRFNKSMKPQDVRTLDYRMEMTTKNVESEMYQWIEDRDSFINLEVPGNEWEFYKSEA